MVRVTKHTILYNYARLVSSMLVTKFIALTIVKKVLIYNLKGH